MACSLSHDETEAIWRRRTLAGVYDPRRNMFDFVRFVLATVVLWSHSYALLGREQDPIFAASGQIDAGGLAVDGFFVLSGFLILQSWLAAPQARTYWMKRGLRIVPAMIVALVFGAFIVAPLFVSDGPAEYFASRAPWEHLLGVVLNRYLAIEGAFGRNPLPGWTNASLWSLRYEMLCYAAIALLAGRLEGVARQRLLLLFAVAWTAFATANVLGLRPMGIPFTLSRLVACFAGGGVVYAWRARMPASWFALGCAALLLGLSFFLGGFRLVFPLVGAYALIRASCGDVLRLARFGRHGDFSYGMYVFAYPIQQSLVSILGASTSVPVLFGSSFVLTLGAATLSWHLVESPALRLKSVLASRRVPNGHEATTAVGPSK
jgi:peptidoglycan/LPS O-acetylase OafA/YrhL